MAKTSKTSGSAKIYISIDFSSVLLFHYKMEGRWKNEVNRSETCYPMVTGM